MYVDLETTGLDPRLPDVDIRLISLNGQVFDLYMGEGERARRELESRKDELFVAHNAQFDLDFLEEWGYHHDGPIFDTMVAWQMLMAGRRDATGRTESAALGNVMKKLFDIEMDKTYQKIDWSAMFLEPAAFEYAANDTIELVKLHEKLEQGLKIAGLSKMFKLEMQLLPVLLAAKRKGVYLDRVRALRVMDVNRRRAEQIASHLPARVNPRAPVQVASYLGLPDSTEDTLREFVKKTDNVDAKRIMHVRKRLKKASTIEKQLLNRVRSDGRIHPTFKQTFTETGRLSASEPNLQNQDRGSDVRGLFKPEQGYRFVISDYSQLELRLAAYFSGDEAMLGAYAAGRDLHEETMLRIFGEQKDKDAQKKARTLSKNINFGLVFGGGHNTLVKFAAKNGVEIDEATAKEYRDAFREAYPTLYKWQQREGSVPTEYLRTALGRRRYIPVGEGYCTRINNVVQGSAADGMKLALVILYRKHGVLPVLNVHDEVVVECLEDEAQWTLETVKSVMENAMYRATKQNPENPVVRIVAEAEIAKSWAEK